MASGAASTTAPFLPQWPAVFEMARGIVKDLGLDYYTANPANLTLTEALHLILTKVRFGTGMPAEIKGAPWKLEQGSIKKKVNAILEHSMKTQMGTIPGTEFSDFILSGAVMALAGLLHVYFKTISIQSELSLGILQFNDNPNSDGAPHIWLEINGQIIDNCFAYIPPEKGSQEFYFKMKEKILYVKEDPETTTRKLFSSDEVSPHSLKIFKLYANSKNVEKYLVSCFRTVQVNPSIKMYDIVMRDFMQRTMGKPVIHLEEKWSQQCWHCETKEDQCDPGKKLKGCSICKMAKYCGSNCQKRDWKAHKLLHQEIEHAVALKARQPENQSEVD